MVWSGYKYHEEGNKNIYAYGKGSEQISYCGFIRADNVKQANECLSLLRHQWSEPGYVLYLRHSTEDCLKEMERRKKETAE